MQPSSQSAAHAGRILSPRSNSPNNNSSRINSPNNNPPRNNF